MIKLVYSYSRVAIPLMLGICIGIALSFMILPLVEETSCESRTSDLTGSSKDNYHKSVPHKFMQGLDIDSFQRPEFEPKVVQPKDSGSSSAPRPARYRFIRTEISAKDPFFLTYTTTPEQLQHRAIALHRSYNLVDYRVDTVFFVHSAPLLPPTDDLPVVVVSSPVSNQLPFRILKHLALNDVTVEQYKYTLLMPDTTLVRVDEMKKLLMDVRGAHYLGFSQSGSSGYRCDLSVGFILSSVSLILHMYDE